MYYGYACDGRGQEEIAQVSTREKDTVFTLRPSISHRPVLIIDVMTRQQHQMFETSYLL